MPTNEGHSAIAVLLHLKAISTAFGFLCITAPPVNNACTFPDWLRFTSTLLPMELTFGGAWSSVLSFASLALSCPR